MPIGFDYRCDNCDHQWMLFSTRLTLGPVQWGETKYTCFSCQTFLSIAKSVDQNSWNRWLDINSDSINQNPTMQQLAESISNRLDGVNGLTPIEINFKSIDCPTCSSDQLSVVPFGQHKMKCEKCGDYTGEFVNDDGITIYWPIDPNSEIA